MSSFAAQLVLIPSSPSLEEFARISSEDSEKIRFAQLDLAQVPHLLLNYGSSHAGMLESFFDERSISYRQQPLDMGEGPAAHFTGPSIIGTHYAVRGMGFCTISLERNLIFFSERSTSYGLGPDESHLRHFDRLLQEQGFKRI